MKAVTRKCWIVLLALAASGCTQSVFTRSEAPVDAPEAVAPDHTPPATRPRAAEIRSTPEKSPDLPARAESNVRPSEAAKPEGFWQQLVAARQFTDCSYDPNIEAWAKRLTASPANFNANAVRMQPYLEYVFRRVQSLDMPSEIAFLPLVESDYRQVYGSYGSPGGWWQLMPAVGKMYGLSVSRDNDERLDPVKATDVALKLTAANAARFQRDWLLTIFAYNVGGQRIANALVEVGLEPGRIEHVSQLNLPKTTEDHLHRMIAWGCIFANPSKYRVSLPNDLLASEQFTDIRITQTTPLKAIEASLGRFSTYWAKQHPIIEKRGEIRYGQHVLAPAGVNLSIAALGDLKRFKQARTTPVLVAKTNAVRSTAARSVATARTTATRTARVVSTTASRRAVVNVPGSYKVRNGDNLWTIARRFDMRVKEILAMNPKLTRETVLQRGQRLRLK